MITITVLQSLKSNANSYCSTILTSTEKRPAIQITVLKNLSNCVFNYSFKYLSLFVLFLITVMQ